MVHVFLAEGWRQSVMSWHDPHRQLEPLEKEIEAIDGALEALAKARVLPHSEYDKDKMLAQRTAVRDTFDIPWSAISPRMERLLYAINAIAKPAVMVAVGVFCGYTFICNAGAAIGPGACYEARRLVGLEIRPREAERARRNVAALVGDNAPAEIIAADGVRWLQEFEGTVDLLYLDADGPRGQGKSIYLELLQSALSTLRSGSLVLAHNSVNYARGLSDYLQVVRDPAEFRESLNIVIDDQGLEVSIR